MERNFMCTREINRKRKLQAEELGTPPSKHKWSSRSFATGYVLSLDSDSDGKRVYRVINSGDLAGMPIVDESEQESAKGSNSFATDADSTVSVCNEAEVGADQSYLKECSSDQHLTSSVHWGGDCSKHALNSSGSSLVTKLDSDVFEAPSTGKEHDIVHLNMEDHQSSMNYEEHLLEFGCHADCNYSECTDKELEEMLYSNGSIPKGSVLSSGRWTPNQGTEQGAEKLTIDKEFEQYFSTLML